MSRKIIIICGFVLLLGSTILSLYIYSLISGGNSAALALDQQVLERHQGGPSSECEITSLRAAISKRTISQNDTVAVGIAISQLPCSRAYPLTISLEAPQFDATPSAINYTSMIPAHRQEIQVVQQSWVLTPKQQGTFDIVISLSSENVDLGYQQLGLNVTNAFGLNIWQAQLISYIGGFLGTFFGPIFTFTWWYDRWKTRKKEKEAHSANNALVNTELTQSSRKKKHSKRK